MTEKPPHLLVKIGSFQKVTPMILEAAKNPILRSQRPKSLYQALETSPLRRNVGTSLSSTSAAF
jgi:hypothetical protein